MSNVIDLKVLVLEPNEAYHPLNNREDVILQRVRGTDRFLILRDRYGYFKTYDEPTLKEEPKRETLFGFDPDTIESLVDAGARKLKRFVRDLNGK